MFKLGDKVIPKSKLFHESIKSYLKYSSNDISNFLKEHGFLYFSSYDANCYEGVAVLVSSPLEKNTGDFFKIEGLKKFQEVDELGNYLLEYV